jgi:hypothetical protein
MDTAMFRKKRTFRDIVAASVVAISAVTSSCAKVAEPIIKRPKKAAVQPEKKEIDAVATHPKYVNVVEMKKVSIKPLPATAGMLAWEKSYNKWIAEFQSILSKYNEALKGESWYRSSTNEHAAEAEKRWQELFELAASLGLLEGERKSLENEMRALVDQANAGGKQVDFFEIKELLLRPMARAVPRLRAMIQKLMRDYTQHF